jgi:hypothetical protein
MFDRKSEIISGNIPTASVTRQYLAQEGPLGYNLTLFNPDVTQGYNNTDELASDIENVARFLISTTVKRVQSSEGYYGGADTMVNRDQDPPETVAFASSDSAAGASLVGDLATDYGTNNQESGIEQGDIIVSDGTYGMFHTVSRFY